MKYRKVKRFLAAGLAALAFSSPVQAQAMDEGEVAELAALIGPEYGISPELLQAVAWVESRYQETASAGGCEGLMQVSEYWHRDRMERLGVEDLYDAAGNMLVAADYLGELSRRYQDPAMALMVYNGDSSAWDYWNGKAGISFYAKEVLDLEVRLERLHGK